MYLTLPSSKLDYACDVISMFKIKYTIAFHGIWSNGLPLNLELEAIEQKKNVNKGCK